jgi:formate dehydrogenase beta subunit
VPAYTEFGAYRRAGGNELLSKVRSGVLPVSDVIDAVEKSGLGGLGGAGSPPARNGPSLSSIRGLT